MNIDLIMSYWMVLGYIAAPFIFALLLLISTKILKFSANNYKTALQCSLIIVGTNIALALFAFLLNIATASPIFLIFIYISPIACFFVGAYAVSKLYKETAGRSFFAILISTVLSIVLSFILSIIFTVVLAFGITNMRLTDSQLSDPSSRGTLPSENLVYPSTSK